jgi:hypothetical protein
VGLLEIENRMLVQRSGRTPDVTLYEIRRLGIFGFRGSLI